MVGDSRAPADSTQPSRVPQGGRAVRAIGAEASANWLWLAAPSHWDRALEVGSSSRVLTLALAHHFRTVHHLYIAPADRGAGALPVGAGVRCRGNAALGVLGEAPYRTASFDCVAFHSPFPATLNDLHQALITECARILRPGGCLHMTCANPFHYRAIPDWPTFLAVGSHLLGPSQLRKLGFHRVRTYYVVPSVQAPRAFVPASRRAVAVVETIDGETTTLARLRRAVVLGGLAKLAYPWLMFLAYR